MRQYPFNGTPIVTNTFRSDHRGVDYALVHRTAIVSIAKGIVTEVKGDERRNWLANTESDPYKPIGFPIIKRSLRTADYGNYIKINHGSGVESLYAHLHEVNVFEGQEVDTNELIGYSDNTGNSTGNHLHFEIRVNGKTVDPDKFYVVNKNFKGKGGEEEQYKFYPFETVVTVKPEVDTLFVRENPARIFSLAGTQKLTGGDTVVVKGFVKGERVKYGKINTQFWWKSALGHYFWAGGTTLIPTLDNFPEEISKRDKILRGEYMDELNQLKQDLLAREEELVSTLNDVRSELGKVAEAIEKTVSPVESVEAIVDQPEVEEVDEAVEEAPVEEAVEEQPEEVVEEPIVEEEPVEEVEEVEADTAEEVPADEEIVEQVNKVSDMIADIRAKLGL